MSERQRPDDLRERMQRIAVKPAAEKRRARSPRAMERRAGVGATATLKGSGARQSRLRTLVAWARWELAVVPEERWRWLLAVTRPGGEPTQGDTR